VRAGVTGAATLGLTDLLRLERRAAAAGLEPSGKSLIVLWLWGGPSHMETFDLKPDAPLEFRGDFRPIATSVPGIEIGEHLPLLARLADKFALVRSLRHDSPGHVSATHTMLTGYPGEVAEAPPYRPKYPDAWSVVSKEAGPQVPGLPAHVALPRLRYQGAAYLGRQFDPLVVDGDPNAAGFQAPTLGLEEALRPRFSERMGLLERFDRYRRAVDAGGAMEAGDEFQRQALSILSSAAARDACDLAAEPEAVRERYGRHDVGQRCLLARRLVEAGTRLVTIDFPCVAGQKAFSRDDHASVWNIFEQMRIRLPVLDQVASALIEDLHARGLADRVLLAVMGEMSHTPRLNHAGGQPGREHWSQAISLLLAGGGLRMGQVVGATNSRGEEPRQRPLSPLDLQATWYRLLGVPLDRQYRDFGGRPTPILPHGEPISELI
jgi:hypothetical protein